jgi:hypothetical protein
MSTEIQKAQMGNTTAVGFNFFDPQQFDIMQRYCKLFASSDLVPEIYKAQIKPIPVGANEQQVAQIQADNQSAMTKAMANCMIALDYAFRVGASPLMVMQNVAIIYGRPAPASKFLIATVNSCGRFEPLQFRFTEKGAMGMVDYTDYVWNDRTRKKEAVNKQFDGKNIQDIECVAFTTKRGSDEVLESVPVSIRMAVQEGWYTKSGSKWVTMPKLMLTYRAASMWTNTYAPELSMGMRTIEEQQDIVDVDFEDVTNKEQRVVKVNLPQREAATQAAEPTTNEAPAPAQQEEPKQVERAKEEQPEHKPQATSTPQAPTRKKAPF